MNMNPRELIDDQAVTDSRSVQVKAPVTGPRRP